MSFAPLRKIYSVIAVYKIRHFEFQGRYSRVPICTEFLSLSVSQQSVWRIPPLIEYYPDAYYYPYDTLVRRRNIYKKEIWRVKSRCVYDIIVAAVGRRDRRGCESP